MGQNSVGRRTIKSRIKSSVKRTRKRATKAVANRLRVWIPVPFTEIAKYTKTSTRRTRYKFKDDATAYKVGSRWYKPMTATEYARMRGMQAGSVRKRKGAVRTHTPQQAKTQFELIKRQELEEKARKNLRRLADKSLAETNAKRAQEGKSPRTRNDKTIDDRIEKATPEQLVRAKNARSLDFDDELMEIDDGLSLYQYH